MRDWPKTGKPFFAKNGFGLTFEERTHWLGPLAWAALLYYHIGATLLPYRYVVHCFPPRCDIPSMLCLEKCLAASASYTQRSKKLWPQWTGVMLVRFGMEGLTAPSASRLLVCVVAAKAKGVPAPVVPMAPVSRSMS